MLLLVEMLQTSSRELTLTNKHGWAHWFSTKGEHFRAQSVHLNSACSKNGQSAFIRLIDHLVLIGTELLQSMIHRFLELRFQMCFL